MIKWLKSWHRWKTGLAETIVSSFWPQIFTGVNANLRKSQKRFSPITMSGKRTSDLKVAADLLLSMILPNLTSIESPSLAGNSRKIVKK